MKHLLVPVLIILAFSLLIQCNKDNERMIIEGNITDSIQHTPIAGAEAMLFGVVISPSVYNPNPVLITSAISDANGDFKIDIPQVKASDLEFRVVKDQYFDHSVMLNSGELAEGKAYYPSVQLSPEGFIKLKVQNTNPIDTSDNIFYRIISNNPTGTGCCISDWQLGIGKNYNTESVCRTKGGQAAWVFWFTHKGTVYKSDSVSVNIPVFDTAFYHLTY
jgi:hypothetical protein